MRKVIVKKAAVGMLACMLGVLTVPWMPGTEMSMVHATQEAVSSNSTKTINRTSDNVITDDDRADADEDMLYFMNSLKTKYRLDEKMAENVQKAFDSAVYYIANTEMSLTEMWAYVSQAKSAMEAAAVANVSQTTSEFLQVGDNWETPSVFPAVHSPSLHLSSVF